MFEEIGDSITNLFPKDKKYTFLAGAGVSMESPSKLPSARHIVRDLISLCAPKEEVEMILSLDLLRYELVVEKIKYWFDNDLDFMNYFELSKQPNVIHFMLAHAIKGGNNVRNYPGREKGKDSHYNAQPTGQDELNNCPDAARANPGFERSGRRR